MLFDEFGEDFDSPDDVGDGAAAREVGDGTVKPLKDRSSDGKAGELLKDFVNEVARIEIRGDEDVSLTGDLVGFGVGVLRVAFVETNTRIDGGVELHFSGDKDIAFGEARKSFLDNVDSSIFAAAANGREREHGDAWSIGEEFLGGSVGLLNDFSELIGGRVLAGGHVGEKVEFGVATHDNEAGESFIRLLRLGVGRHLEMVAAGKDDVASTVFDAGDHGISGAVLDHLAGGSEVGRGNSLDLGPGSGKMLERLVSAAELVVSRNRFLDNGVVEFGEGDF